jgi:hypothetical protein
MGALDEEVLDGSAPRHPLPLTKGEASAMSAWVDYLTDPIDEGVMLTLAQRAGKLVAHLRRPVTPGEPP